MTNSTINYVENIPTVRIQSGKSLKHFLRDSTCHHWPRLYYRIQVDGDFTFRLGKASARKKGVPAIFTAIGWVYHNEKDAEEIAKRWTCGKRILSVVPYYDPRLDEVWYGSKEESERAKKDIRLEIDKRNANNRQQEIERLCNASGLHWSFLYSETQNREWTTKERKAYAYYKPLWDKAKEEQEYIQIKEQDFVKEKEDQKEFHTECNEVYVNGIPKKITDLESLHKRFAQLEVSGQPCILINRLDSQPITQSDLSRRLSGEVVLLQKDSDGLPKYMSADKYWFGNARKCIYTKIAFTNEPVDDSVYNLFPGFGITPRKGNCELILAHIKEVICSGNESSYNAFIKLLAWQIQNIGKPSRIITVLKSSTQQVGKGCLLADILAVIYGNSGFITSDAGQITSRFNDTIRGKAYVFLDEALYSGDRKAADAIKSLATCTRMGIETKGVPTVQFPIAVNLFLATNHDDAAHIEETDARYWIMEVSPHRAKDTQYFKELYFEIENGGREAFMELLLTLEVTDFVPTRDILKDNAAKEAMIHNSINPYDARKWIEECLVTEMLIGCKRQPSSGESNLPWESWEKGKEYENGVFYSAYVTWQNTVKSSIAARSTPVNKFGELLNELGFIQRNQGGRRRILPDRDLCKEALHQTIMKYGK